MSTKTWALILFDPTNGPFMFATMVYPPEQDYPYPWEIGEIFCLPVSTVFHLCYPLFSYEWNLVETLARERNIEELEWLICLLVLSDPYSDEALCPVYQVSPYEPDEYARIMYSLILLCVDISEDVATDWPY